MSDKIFIKDVRTYITSKKSGGDYHLQEKGHWISDIIIANPMFSIMDVICPIFFSLKNI